MVREMRPHARVIAVTGGKGGVGKTNVAVNLAIAIARLRRKRVALIDADLGLANVDIMLDLHPHWNLGHVLEDRCRVEDTIVAGPDGVEIVPGASGLAHLADLQDGERRRLLEELSRLEGREDFCLVDTAAGIGETVVTLASGADDCVIVTTPEPPSIADAYATIKTIARRGQVPRLHLVVNMVGSRQEAARVYERVSSVTKRFLGVDLLDAGYVFCDGHVSRAVRRRKAFFTEFPNSQATWCMRQVAERVVSPAPGVETESRGGGFFQRVAGLFSNMTT